jgi:hypothetical protein
MPAGEYIRSPKDQSGSTTHRSEHPSAIDTPASINQERNTTGFAYGNFCIFEIYLTLPAFPVPTRRQLKMN